MSEVSNSGVEVLCSQNYEMFHFMKGNRHLNDAKIKKIIFSVQNGLDLFKYCPIMVNNDHYVIDGQHRFACCKKLKFPIYYVVVPKFTLRQVAEMNNNASRWTSNDFLQCYIDIGYPDYKQLQKFIDANGVNIGVAISLLSSGSVTSGHQDDFKDGLFKVEYLEKAERLMEHAKSYAQLCPTYRTRNFLRALEVLNDSTGYNQDEVIEKLSQHQLTIEQKNSPKEYLQHLEELFNFHNSKRRRIY